jgi:hypothetical protein
VRCAGSTGSWPASIYPFIRLAAPALLPPWISRSCWMRPSFSASRTHQCQPAHGIVQTILPFFMAGIADRPLAKKALEIGPELPIE